MNLDGSDIAYFDLAVSYPFDKSLGWCGFDFDDYDDSQYMGFDNINEQDFLIFLSSTTAILVNFTAKMHLYDL